MAASGQRIRRPAAPYAAGARDLYDWMPDRIGPVFQRFDQFRERAEGMVSRAERFLNLAREQASRPVPPPEPAEQPQPPAPADPA